MQYSKISPDQEFAQLSILCTALGGEYDTRFFTCVSLLLFLSEAIVQTLRIMCSFTNRFHLDLQLIDYRGAKSNVSYEMSKPHQNVLKFVYCFVYKVISFTRLEIGVRVLFFIYFQKSRTWHQH